MNLFILENRHLSDTSVISIDMMLQEKVDRQDKLLDVKKKELNALNEKKKQVIILFMKNEL